MEGVIVRNEKMEGPLCTNCRANGANTAPCAGLTNIIATSVTILDPISQSTHLAIPWRDVPLTLS
jgi:hypothetical protein